MIVTRQSCVAQQMFFVANNVALYCDVYGVTKVSVFLVCYGFPSQPGGGGHFNLIYIGVCGHRIGKLTHPQTKAGPSINKNRPILRLFTIEID